MLTPEQRAVTAECQAAFEQVNAALLDRTHCFSWQCLQVSHALSRMYAAGVQAERLGLQSNYHQLMLSRAAKDAGADDDPP